MARGKSDEPELIGFTDIAGFSGVENGEVIVRPLEVSVNEEVKGLPTKYSQRIHGERIEIYKRQLPAKTGSQMSAVEKQWKEVQKPFEQVSGKMSVPSKKYEPEEYQPEGKQDLSPLGVLKNFTDDLSKRVINQGNWTKLGLILGTVGVCGFIMALAIILK